MCRASTAATNRIAAPPPLRGVGATERERESEHEDVREREREKRAPELHTNGVYERERERTSFYSVACDGWPA